MKAVSAPSRAPVSRRKASISAVTSTNPMPVVCTSSCEVTMSPAVTVEGGVREADLDVVTVNSRSLSRPGEDRTYTAEAFRGPRWPATFATPTAWGGPGLRRDDTTSNPPRGVLLHSVGHVDQAPPGAFQEGHRAIKIGIAGQRNFDLAPAVRFGRDLLVRFGQGFIGLAWRVLARRELRLQLLVLGLQPADLVIHRLALVRHGVAGPAIAIIAAG